MRGSENAAASSSQEAALLYEPGDDLGCICSRAPDVSHTYVRITLH
jgi:hypothetical protein